MGKTSKHILSAFGFLLESDGSCELVILTMSRTVGVKGELFFKRGLAKYNYSLSAPINCLVTYCAKNLFTKMYVKPHAATEIAPV